MSEVFNRLLLLSCNSEQVADVLISEVLADVEVAVTFLFLWICKSVKTRWMTFFDNFAGVRGVLEDLLASFFFRSSFVDSLKFGAAIRIPVSALILSRSRTSRNVTHRVAVLPMFLEQQTSRTSSSCSRNRRLTRQRLAMRNQRQTAGLEIYAHILT